jgi:hypothetical protein
VELVMLPTSGRLAVEVDGLVEGYAEPGDQVTLRARPQAARVIRLGRTTFYQRARRKLRLTDSAEIPLSFGDGDGDAHPGMGQLNNPLNDPLARRDGAAELSTGPLSTGPLSTGPLSTGPLNPRE